MHYTLNSGVQTVSITSRCPICLAVKEHTWSRVQQDERLSSEELCCSREHAVMWVEVIVRQLVLDDRDVDDSGMGDTALSDVYCDRFALIHNRKV